MLTSSPWLKPGDSNYHELAFLLLYTDQNPADGTQVFQAWLTGTHRDGKSAFALSAPVSVTWTPQCHAPGDPPPPYLASYHLQCGANGSQVLTWTDARWVLRKVDGCEKWVTIGTTYTHTYTQTFLTSTRQIVGLLSDPGTPSQPWTPFDPSATQDNHNGKTDGSGFYDLPTFGNPLASPAVYVRSGSGFAFRIAWSGSPFDLPASAQVTFTLTNPNGSTRTWTLTNASAHYPVLIAKATLVRPTFNGVPLWTNLTNAQGYPQPATEYVAVYTPIPKYTNDRGGLFELQLAAWNLTGNPNTAAHIRATISVQTQQCPVSVPLYVWHDIAQEFNYPMWYFIHQVPPATAKELLGATTYAITNKDGTIYTGPTSNKSRDEF
jgi:hypothetical protein